MHHTEIQAIRQRRGAFSASSMQPAAGSFPYEFLFRCKLPPARLSRLSRACLGELVAGLSAGTSQPCGEKTIHPMLVGPRLQGTHWVHRATTSWW